MQPDSAVSPMMQQYQEAKRAHPQALLLFRMGDFYELFHEDAQTAARLLGLTLTSRDKGENPIPMAGFPYHQLESYLGRLLAAGQRAAICEQVEDPRKAKGLVRRQVVRVVTPGTVTDEALLPPRDSNYLAAMTEGDPAGLAWVELSTGRFQAAQVPRAKLADELARLDPAECLVREDAATNGEFSRRMVLTRRPPWAFAAATAIEALARQFGTATLEGFGFDLAADSAALAAAGAVLDYLQETQQARLDHLDRLLPYRPAGTLQLDQATRRALEIQRTLRDGGREHSLLWAVDRTVTPLGARLLADWVANPPASRGPIELRLDAVEELVAEESLAAALTDALRHVYDMERLLARATTGRASPRDLAYLGRTLRLLPEIKARLAARRSRLLEELEAGLDLCPELRSRLDAALEEECPLSYREGGFIRGGYHAELDRVRDLAAGGKQWIAGYQAQEIARTGIPSLKVGFNKVFGYYLEVTHTHREKIPVDYIRKQTVKNSERYVTPELKRYEEEVLAADEKAKELEAELFAELRDAVVAHARRLQATAAAVAQLDVLLSLAGLARQRGYCRPTLVEQPELRIVEGRHPVLDLTEAAGTFVPNDVRAGRQDGQVLLITGPNMAGKSTYIRQAALITFLAHLGSFVPAREATIGLADRIFARVGAGDELSRGQSTFMVEMTETARILNTATAQSLVILDEIGRGTSTYDGLSLAWAVVEFLHDQIGCRTLFATHYHELTDLSQNLARLRNLNVAVHEQRGQVVFLHRIVPGAADKSYGIHVAKLAGVPRAVVQRAQAILADLERQSQRPEPTGRAGSPRPKQLTLFGPSDDPLLDEIRELDLDRLSPLEALNRLHAWQAQLRPPGGERPSRDG